MAVSALIHGLVALPGGDTVTTFVTRSVTEGRREEAGAILRLTLVVSQGLALVGYAVIVVLTLTVSSLLGISEFHVNAMLLYGMLGVFLATRSEALAVLRLADRRVPWTGSHLGSHAHQSGPHSRGVADGRRAVRGGDGICRRRRRQRDRDVRSSSSVRPKGGGRRILDFGLAEVSSGCDKVPIRDVRKNEDGDIGAESGLSPDGPICVGGGCRHLQSRTPDYRHGQTPPFSSFASG